MTVPGSGGRTPPAQRPFASQARRLPAALSGARLDARGFPDLVAEATKVAGLIRFDEDATWQDLLTLDAVPSLALLATVDAHARLRAPPAAGADGTHARLRGRVEALFALAADVDRWLAPLEGASRNGVGAALERAVVGVLAPRLRQLRERVAEVGVAGLAADGFDALEGGLAARWRSPARAEAVRRTARAIEDDAHAKAVLAVDDAADAFVRELARAAERSRAELDAALLRPDHLPHVALLMALCALLRHAQGAVNAVPMRIVDHYRSDLLREAPHGSEPDAVLLVAVRKPAATQTIPRGAEFEAGTGPDGRAALFAAERPLPVTGAVFAAARVWRPDAGDGAFPPAVTFATLEPQPDGAVGDADLGIAGVEAKARAESALVLASAAFGAAGASKRILIVVEPADAAAVPLDALEVGASVSAADGWIPVEPHSVAFRATGLAVELRFDAASPVLAVGPPGLCPGVEAVRLTFGRAAGALAGTALKGAWASVAVVDAASVGLCDAEDPLGGDAAPAPFGSPPSVGRRMRIDHPGLAGPDLRRMALGLTWDALPPWPGGFADHYRPYVVDREGRVGDAPLLNNASFKVRIVTPLAGRPSADLPLFQVQAAGEAERIPDVFAGEGRFTGSPPDELPASGPLARTSWFAFEAPVEGAEDRGPDHASIELTAPAEGFGDGLYPVNVAYAGLRVARAAAPAGPSSDRAASSGEPPGARPAAAGGPAAFVLPPPPWRPALRAVRLDYARVVTTTSRKGPLTLFHDVPGEGLTGVAAAPASPVLRALPSGPTLDIGLRDLGHHRAVSLMVRVAPERTGDAGGSAPTWSYRRTDGWRPLRRAEARAGYEGPPAPDTVVDGTDGLRATGLVVLPVPGDAARDGAGIVWFRAGLGAKAAMPAVTAVRTDAFRAVRVLSDPRDPLVPVPAGTIARAPGLVGLARLDQPLASAGGRPPERADDLRSRATERLRHRQRATRIWDVERIVLAACPDVAKVRVGGALAEGPLRVLPIPGSPGPRPQFTPARRDEIRALVAASASPFAEVDVVAPRYRDVDLEAEVLLDPAVDPFEAASRLSLDLAALLSPLADPGLRPEEIVNAAVLRTALRAFIQGRPSVSRVRLRTVALRAVPGADEGAVGFADVPVAGSVAVVPVRPSVAGSWP